MTSTSGADFQRQLDSCAAEVATANRAIDEYHSQVTNYTGLAALAEALKLRLTNAGYGQNFQNVRPFYVAVPGYNDIHNDGGFIIRDRKKTGDSISYKCYTQSLNLGPQYNPLIYAAALRSLLASNTTWASNDPTPLTVNDIYYVDVRTGTEKCKGSYDVTAYCYKTAARINFENLQLSNAADASRLNGDRAATVLPQVVKTSCAICQNVNSSSCGPYATCYSDQNSQCSIQTTNAQRALDECSKKGGTLKTNTTQIGGECILPAAAPSAQVVAPAAAAPPAPVKTVTPTPVVTVLKTPPTALEKLTTSVQSNTGLYLFGAVCVLLVAIAIKKSREHKEVVVV